MNYVMSSDDMSDVEMQDSNSESDSLACVCEGTKSRDSDNDDVSDVPYWDVYDDKDQDYHRNDFTAGNGYKPPTEGS